MRTRILGIVLALAAVLTVLAAPAHAATSWLSGHVQNLGWTDARVQADEPRVATVGTTGKSLRMEALRINDIDSPLVMQAHVQNLGWGPQSTREVGTTGRSLRMEAVRIWSPLPAITTHCQAHVQNLGWLPEVTGGAVCGTTGKSLRLEAVRVWLTYEDGPPVVVDPVQSTVVAVGDVGLEDAGRANLSSMGKTNATLALLLGDLAYSPPAQSFCDTVKSSIPGTVGWVQGNHENRDADAVTGNPATGDDTAAYQVCMPTTAGAEGETGIQQVIRIPGARVITASPQETADGYAPGSPRWTWVRDQIRAALAAGDWPILAMHEPHYTPGTHGPAGPDSKALTDLAITERVPLVLAGHDHVYGRKTVDGTTFVVAGMGGHNPRTLTTPDGWAVTNPGSAFGFVKLTIRAHSLVGEFAGVDRFEVTR